MKTKEFCLLWPAVGQHKTRVPHVDLYDSLLELLQNKGSLEFRKVPGIGRPETAMKGSIVSKSRAQQLNAAILAGILLWSFGCQICSPEIYNLQPCNTEAL